MSMALFYEHDTPVADRPTGFVLNDTADFLFGGAEGWERKERTFEELGSGHHRSHCRTCLPDIALTIP